MSDLKRDHFRGRTAKILGTVLIICSLVGIVAQFTMIGLKGEDNVNRPKTKFDVRTKRFYDSDVALVTGYGLWTNLLPLVAGAVSVAAGISKKTSLVIACLVLSTLSALSGTVQFIMASIDYTWADILRAEFDELQFHAATEGKAILAVIYGQLAMHLNTAAPLRLLLLFTGLAECVMSIILASICCCCGVSDGCCYNNCLDSEIQDDNIDLVAVA